MWIFWMCSSLILCLPLFENPITMAAMVVLVSLVMAGGISGVSCFWFCYILFLVYVGGLLVMFIYICLVSSNYPLKLSALNLGTILLCSLIISLSSEFPSSPSFLGFSGWFSGEDLLEVSSLSLFLFLVILLLVMLLVVVRISGAGSFIVGIER